MFINTSMRIKGPKIFLDGKEVTGGILEADDDKGYVVIVEEFPRDLSLKTGYYHQYSEIRARVQILRGEVEFQWRKDIHRSVAFELQAERERYKFHYIVVTKDTADNLQACSECGSLLNRKVCLECM